MSFCGVGGTCGGAQGIFLVWCLGIVPCDTWRTMRFLGLNLGLLPANCALALEALALAPVYIVLKRNHEKNSVHVLLQAQWLAAIGKIMEQFYKLLLIF